VTKGDVIESTRLILEPLTIEQCAAFLQGDRGAQRWAPGFPTDGDLRQAHLLVNQPERAVSPRNAWGPYTLVEKVTGLCIGGVGFKGQPDAVRSVEIGYGVSASRQGHGFVSEAVGRLCDLARVEGAHRIVAETDGANLASQRVLEKCGFTHFTNDADSLWWRLEL
jgi:ribosomal-protein-alanine N-acetyltransferase